MAVRRDSTLNAAFADLPTEPTQRLDSLRAIHEEMRQAFRKELQPVVRTLLQDFPPDNDLDRKRLAMRINQFLHEVGLAILDPRSGLPSSLVVEPYRIVLQSRAPNEEGKRVRTGNLKSLPPLQLVEHIRLDPFHSRQYGTRDESRDRGR